ncbi:D-alanyl-D-alanine carboxypeptidase [Salinarimonas soli]|nr:D-alanyl-D-alanine carboxypeptidase [Salinarimonas soli]
MAVGAAATVLVASASPADAARRKRASGGYNPPYAAMVVDVKTGRTLHAVNEDALRHPASVTKVMTLYLLFEQLERGRYQLDTPLAVSARAAGMAPSKLGLRAGSTIDVEDAILALVTKSANDAAATIAENVAGSETAFADLMTRRARQLGMSRTVFRNASGLPNPQQVTTARDLTILARAIQDRFPKYYKYFQTRQFEFAGRVHGNHNRLLGRVEGVDGIKTGFVRASGFNLMTNAKTDDRHIVAVVLGGRSGAHRDGIVTNLVETLLPRAYAGARQTAPILVAGDQTPVPARPAVVAEAPKETPKEAPRARADVNVETTATTTPVPQARPKAPLDLNAMRPAVASAAGGSTTTPGSGPALRWNQGPAGTPASASAFASADSAALPLPAAHAARAEAPRPATVVAKAEPKAETKPEPARAAASAWVIQLGAVDDEGKAKEMLEAAKSRSGRTLAKASPFTEKVTRDGSTLFRARFSGFSEADDAQDACRTLKRNGFNCFATRS